MTFGLVVQIQAKLVVTENHYSLIVVQLSCEMGDWFPSSSCWTGRLNAKITAPSGFVLRQSLKKERRKGTSFIFHPQEYFGRWGRRKAAALWLLPYGEHHSYHQAPVKRSGTLFSFVICIMCFISINKSGIFIRNSTLIIFIVKFLVSSKLGCFHHFQLEKYKAIAISLFSTDLQFIQEVQRVLYMNLFDLAIAHEPYWVNRWCIPGMRFTTVCLCFIVFPSLIGWPEFNY